MHYFLGILDDLVLYKLKNSNFLSNPSSEKLKGYLSIAKEFKDQFHNRLFSGLLETEKDKQVKKYIQTHQSRLIFLADILFEHIATKVDNPDFVPSGKSTLIETQKAVCLIIEELIKNLEISYGTYFNYNHNLPKRQRLLAGNQYQKNVASLKIALTDTDSQLVDIILSPFFEIIEDKLLPLSFRKATYLKELLIVLQDIANSDTPKKEDLIIKSLVLWDFNSWRFEKFLTKQMLSDIDKEETDSDKLKKYYYYAKIINQTYFYTDKRLNLENQSLNAFLSNWISEEIDFYLKNAQCHSSFSSSPKVTDSDSEMSVITSISVAQLAFLIRLLVDVGVITNPKAKKLLNFFATHFQTKKTNSISTASLYDKYYVIEDSTKEKVKSILLKMVNRAQGDYIIITALIINIYNLDLDFSFIL